MKYSDILQRLSNFHIIVNSNFKVSAVSSNISDSDIGETFFDIDAVDLFSQKYFFDGDVSSKENLNDLECNVLKIIKDAFEGNEISNIKKNIEVRNHNTLMYYSFYFSVYLLTDYHKETNNNVVHILINDFKKIRETEAIYKSHFDEFDKQFDLVKKMNVIGRFIIDYESDKYKVYGNELLPGLLGLQKTDDNFYKLNSRTSESIMENTIVKSELFYERLELLLTGKIDLLTDEWKVADRWLRLEAKIFTRTKNGSPNITGGIIYDVTDFQKYKDLENVHMFYELAINSGQIGMFYYDLERHSPGFFEANEIYAEIFGIDRGKNGLYAFDDFLRAQLPVEDNITEYESVKIQVNKLFEGEITGTNDDILKIQNLKTGDIKYLISSSKVESVFEDGKAKKFGGIVFEITDRIVSEKNKNEYLYKDELTSLGNNRALAKNMLKASDGLGMFFDLDNFKKINDTYGHLMGDQMIIVFGDCLQKVANDFGNIVVYRLYGDEFFVFCEGYENSIASEFSTLVHTDFKTNKEVSSLDIKIEASMGYSIYQASADVDDFIKCADYAMYENKIHKKTIK